MNKKQKILTLVALGAFILTLFAIPTVYHARATYSSPATSYASTTYLWKIDADDRIRFDILFLEWGAIGVISVILFFILKDKDTLKE